MELGLNRETAAVLLASATLAGGMAAEATPVAFGANQVETDATPQSSGVSFEDCADAAALHSDSFAASTSSLRSASGRVIRASGTFTTKVNLPSVEACDGVRKTEDYMVVNGKRVVGTTIRETGNEADTREASRKISLTKVCRKLGSVTAKLVHTSSYTEGARTSTHTDVVRNNEGKKNEGARIKC